MKFFKLNGIKNFIIGIFLGFLCYNSLYALDIQKGIQDLTAYIQKIYFTSDGTPVSSPSIAINGQSGTIGIGTTNPLESIHVKVGNIYGENNAYIMQKIGIGTMSPNKELHIKNISSNAELDIQSIDGANNHWGIYAQRTNNSLNFWQGDNRLTLLNGGNVGIGTTSPGYKLQVNGDIYANGGWLRTYGTAGWYSESYGGGWYMQDNTRIRSYGTKSVRLGGGYYGADGGITIGYGGTTSPAGGGIFAGNVGIGTNTPGSYKLNVNGTIYGSSNLTIGGSASISNNISAGGSISAGSTLSAGSSISAGTNLTVGGSATIQGHIHGVSTATIDGNLQASNVKANCFGNCF